MRGKWTSLIMIASSFLYRVEGSNSLRRNKPIEHKNLAAHFQNALREENSWTRGRLFSLDKDFRKATSNAKQKLNLTNISIFGKLKLGYSRLSHLTSKWTTHVLVILWNERLLTDVLIDWEDTIFKLCSREPSIEPVESQDTAGKFSTASFAVFLKLAPWH